MIPILAGVTQWLSTKLMTSIQSVNDSNEQNPMNSSLKMMNTIMPLMSAFFCITMPSGLGIYWVATSVFTIFQQLILNAYFDHTDMDALIKKNVEKANKKREKKGLPPQKVTTTASYNTKSIAENRIEQQQKREQEVQENKKKMKEATDYYNKGIEKPNSLSAKANMVQQYNEKTEKKRK